MYVDLVPLKRSLVLSILGELGEMPYELLQIYASQLVNVKMTFTPELWRMVDEHLIELTKGIEGVPDDRLRLTFEGWVMYMAQAESGEVASALRVLRRKGTGSRGPI